MIRRHPIVNCGHPTCLLTQLFHAAQVQEVEQGLEGHLLTTVHVSPVGHKLTEKEAKLFKIHEEWMEHRGGGTGIAVASAPTAFYVFGHLMPVPAVSLPIKLLPEAQRALNNFRTSWQSHVTNLDAGSAAYTIQTNALIGFCSWCCCETTHGLQVAVGETVILLTPLLHPYWSAC